jgi:hypothetical protein
MVSAARIHAVGSELPSVGDYRSTQADHDVRPSFGIGLPKITRHVIRSADLIIPNLAFAA